MPRWILAITFIPLAACSLYRSDGRKFLETSLPSIGVTISAYLEGCSMDQNTQIPWQFLYDNEQATLWSAADQPTHVRVIPTVDRTFHCDYRLPDADFVAEHSDLAIEHTLLELLATTPKASRESETSR